MKVMKAIVRVDADEFLQNCRNFEGMLDCADCARAPSEIVDAGDGAASTVATLSVETGDVVLRYEFNPGDEDARIEEVDFQGCRYPCTGDFYSPDCYQALVACLKAE